MFQQIANQGFVEHYLALQNLFYIFFHHVPDAPERFYSKDNYAFWDAYHRANPHRFTLEDIAEYKTALAKPGALTAGLNYYRAILRPEVVPGEVPLLPEKITRPTLLLWGEKEQLCSRSIAERSSEFVDAPFTFRLIPNCGHWIQNEAPELVNRYILEFLADLKY